MSRPQPNYSKYVTPISAPSCVQYWERELYQTPLWLDWTVLKTVVESSIPEVMESLSIACDEATKVLWDAFIEATCGDQQSPCHSAYRNFMRSMDEYHFAYWIPRLTIGSDIHDGFTEGAARQRYANWLEDDPKNSIFGKYRVLPNLKIIKNRHRRFKR